MLKLLLVTVLSLGVGVNYVSAESTSAPLTIVKQCPPPPKGLVFAFADISQIHKPANEQEAYKFLTCYFRPESSKQATLSILMGNGCSFKYVKKKEVKGRYICSTSPEKCSYTCVQYN